MKQTFRILFYIKRNAPLRDGSVPIMGRITVDGKSVQVSTRLSIDPKLWHLHPGRAVGRSVPAEKVNEQLNRIHRKIEQCYELLSEKNEVVTPQMIKDVYTGNDRSREMLLAFFNRHNEEFFQMVGVNRSLSTYNKYRCVYRHLQEFITRHYGCEDLALEKIDRTFLIGFHHFIARECGHKKNTIWIYLIAFKHIVRLALHQGHMHRDPFAGYRLHCEFVPRNYLTFDEINDLLRLDLPNAKMRLVRDAYLFSCFTGLSYADIRRLSPRHIHCERERVWIRISRRKTGTNVAVRLFSVPNDILFRYRSENPDSPIFPLPGNRQCNLYLERIMSMAGIARHMTFHTARHTFATTVTLSQGVSMEIISKLLGHKSIRTTQIYAQVTHEKLDRDMELLSEQLDSLCGKFFSNN